MDLLRRKSSNCNAGLSKSANTNENNNSIFNSSNNCNSSQNNFNNTNDIIKNVRNSVDITSKLQFFEVEADEEDVEKFMNEILNKIEDLENKDSKKFLMEKYADLEIELLKSVKNSTKKLNLNQRKFLKMFIYENLHANFLKYKPDERRKMESKISDVCLEFLKKMEEIKDFKNHFNVDFSYSNLHIEKNNNKEITEILKAMENSFFSEMKFKICSDLNICSVPNFFTKNSKKNLKQKIRKFWKLNYEIPIINLLLESKFGFKFLKDKFRDLIDERLNIFDNRYFSKDLRTILFKFFVIINLDSMKRNKLNLQAFLNNFKKYVYLMGLHEDYDSLINLVVGLTNFEDLNYNEKKKGIIDEICEEFLKIYFPYINFNRESNNLIFGLPNGIKDQNLRNEELLSLNINNFELDFRGYKNSNVNNNNKKSLVEDKFQKDLMNVFIGDPNNTNNKINNDSNKLDLFKDFYSNEKKENIEVYENINNVIEYIYENPTNYNNPNIIKNDLFSENSNSNPQAISSNNNEKCKNSSVPSVPNLEEPLSDETRLLTVFSFSIMLNNLMTTFLVEDNQPVEDSELINIKILFTPNLKCSSRERIFLINLLFAFEFYNNLDFKLKKLSKEKLNSPSKELFKNNSFCLLQENKEENQSLNKVECVEQEAQKFSYLDINYMMENSILSELVKSYSKVLYDESNKQKLVLDNQKIFDIFYNFNENDSIINDYESFLKNNIDSAESNTVKKITSKLKNFYSNISNKFKKPQNSINANNKKIKLDLNNLKFIPLDPISISPHLCLCISGGFIQDTNKENFWLNFGLDDKVMDYYFMNWQEDYYRASFIDSFMDAFNLKTYDEKLNEYKNAFKRNKRLSKGFGKMLAYFLASRYSKYFNFKLIFV